MLGGLARIWIAAAQMCKVALVHACWSHQEWLGSFSVMHLPAPWEGDSFLELRDYLASCPELCETLGSIWPSWVHPETPHLFDIGFDIPLLHCGWDSLTLNKDQH